LSGSTNGTFSCIDPDPGQTVTFATSDPRIEIDGTTLKLKSDQALDIDDGATVIVDVTATDSGVPPQAISQSLTIAVTANPLPWQNTVQPFDSSGDGTVVPNDVLRIINQL